MEKCLSWRGHKFQPRYSYSNPALTEFMSRITKVENAYPGLFESMREEHYEGDICVRCGHVIERKNG